MTESMSLPLITPLDLPSKPLSMGMPALGAELRIVDDAGQEGPPGTVGELVLRGVPGVSLMKGYFKHPDATADAIRGEWLYTGDLAWMDEEGYFHFVDRKKDIIKRAGENVAAGEVEAVLRQHGAVADAAVIGVPDPVRDEAIKALVILREGQRATAEELIEWCGGRLSKFKVPEIVEFRETFPRTSVGKIQKGGGVAAAGSAVGFPAVVSAQARKGVPSDPVKIGVIPIRAGVAAPVGAAGQRGVEGWAERGNKAGGILGREGG